jgi:hypothetical protein
MEHIPRRRYTDDFKAQAILLAESLGPAKAARQLDMSATKDKDTHNFRCRERERSCNVIVARCQCYAGKWARWSAPACPDVGFSGIVGVLVHALVNADGRAMDARINGIATI